MNQKFALALHGGAGTIERSEMTPEKEAAYTKGLKNALDAGFDVLAKGGTAIDAVSAAVVALEDCPLFNAGKGAVFNAQGEHEMDAAVMMGQDRKAGAVAGCRVARNPVLAARAVMERTDHVLLTGAGVDAFVKAAGLPVEEQSYFFDDYRYKQWQEAAKNDVVQLDHARNKMGTVGAVALDRAGNVAAATSTGGMTNKKFGRVGDSPVIGSGTWADNNTCAISCTGHGEVFIKCVTAYDIACLMEYKGLSLAEACREVVHEKLVRMNGEGGLVAIDAEGNIEMPFNSSGMYRAMKTAAGKELIAIYKD